MNVSVDNECLYTVQFGKKGVSSGTFVYKASTPFVALETSYGEKGLGVGYTHALVCRGSQAWVYALDNNTWWVIVNPDVAIRELRQKT